MNPTVLWPDKTLRVAIHCAPGVLTGLEIVATDGLLAMPRIGLGVGGLLLGHRLDDRIVIVQSVEISCSHASGPDFVLTSEEITATLRMATPDAESERDHQVVGWYCSRTRGPLAPTEHDRALFAAFCPEPWQVTLLIRPIKGKVTTAAFGFRGADSETPFQLGEWMDLAWQELAEYQVSSPEPAAAVAAPDESIDPTPDIPVTMPSGGTLFGAIPPTGDAAPEDGKPSRWGFRLLLAVVLLAALCAAAFFTRASWMPAPPVALLASSDWAGRVSILWNVESLGERAQATLVIADGLGPLHTVHLNQGETRVGWSQYDCRAGKATVTLLSGNLSDSVTVQAQAQSFLPESHLPESYLPESGISK